jgi:hypothetical protein
VHQRMNFSVFEHYPLADGVILGGHGTDSQKYSILTVNRRNKA